MRKGGGYWQMPPYQQCTSCRPPTGVGIAAAAETGGSSRLLLRAGRPPALPPELQPHYLVRHPAARIPLTAVEREVFWYDCP